MRSLLFVPGNDERKLAKASGTGADALILDLEDSVALDGKERARGLTREWLADGRPSGSRVYVRINGLTTGLAEADLDTVMAGRPDGVMLPKAEGGSDIRLLDARLAAQETMHAIEDGDTRILAIATETAHAVLQAGTYRGASRRLEGLAWGAEDLAADLGSVSNRDPDGTLREPFRMARTTCLLAAASAQCLAIDTVYPNFRDLEGLRRESEDAATDGFSGKLAIHPAQVAVINEALTPSAGAVEHARRVVAAFGDGAGVASLDGEMIDRPHLLAAQRILRRAGDAGLTERPAGSSGTGR